MIASDFKVGQSVWLKQRVGYDVRELVEGKITKVGLKYLTIDGSVRFDLITLLEDTRFGFKRKLYLSRESHERSVRLSKNNMTLYNYFRNVGANSIKITLEQTEAILKILGIEEDAE